MATSRLDKIGRLLQKELSSIFLEMGRTHFDGAMITVTQVRVSADLANARIYLSLFLTSNKNKLFEEISLQGIEIKKRLNIRMGKQLRVLPHLTFFIDDSLDYFERIDTLLK